ncbi:uncharacterized protein Bfra_001174 [Botrytis fragariae]|uniref:Uncharacterized protein n=1 Tax=Botrytis fragariae TaxID=1964551 RepID=A0A8H6ENL8_9HELO|nr:uncharacterized protein Bfra_001174 [Botrytis fragariae]KAF5879001.1 hypothetical protein Bfra_001174 [Botrytis fragariae]
MLKMMRAMCHCRQEKYYDTEALIFKAADHNCPALVLTDQLHFASTHGVSCLLFHDTISKIGEIVS